MTLDSMFDAVEHSAAMAYYYRSAGCSVDAFELPAKVESKGKGKGKGKTPEKDDLKRKLLSGVKALTARVKALEDRAGYSEAELRVRGECKRMSVSSARFAKVQSNYYDLTLQERSLILGCSVPQLCKTLVFENIACSAKDCGDWTNSRYYCVVVQYTARFQAEKLMRFVRELAPSQGNTRLSRRSFNFQLAPAEVSERITGFITGAVSPFGLASKIPVVIASALQEEVRPAFVWLGGGAVDVKLGLSVKDLMKGLEANGGKGLVADVTDVPPSSD